MIAYAPLEMQNQTTKPKLIVVCGPTGIGKTSLAIEIAEAVGGEIVGADSMQIYRLMDIGTAKPTPAEQARVHHHLIDVVDPDQPFDAARYRRMAQQSITQLHANGRVPLVVGGTGLYIKALLYGLAAPAASDPAVRANLRAIVDRDGTAPLMQRLERCDPATAKKLHPNDAYRIIRALEIYTITGQPASRLHNGHGFRASDYAALTIGLDMPREQLYQRINQRVDLMIAEGLREEVVSLRARGYHSDLKSMQSLGYRHMTAYLDGQIGWDDTVRTLKRDHRRYAKRQLTWFRAAPKIHWQRPTAKDQILSRVRRFLDPPQ